MAAGRQLGARGRLRGQRAADVLQALRTRDLSSYPDNPIDQAVAFASGFRMILDVERVGQDEIRSSINPLSAARR